MAKHSRKKQRRIEAEKPLGSVEYVDNDAEKDEEERRLESLLFGREYRPQGDVKGKQKEERGYGEDSEEDEEGTGNANEVLRDEDVRYYHNFACYT